MKYSIKHTIKKNKRDILYFLYIFKLRQLHVPHEIICPLPYKNVKAETHLIAMASTQHDTDEVTKEARKKKIKELEASLFGNTLDEDGSSWNPR